MTPVKPILQQFVAWLETAYCHPTDGVAREFAVEPPPDTLAFAEMALDAALEGDRPVLLGTTVSVKSVIAALVLKRAGVKPEHVLERSLSEDQFINLAGALREVRNSKLLIDVDKP